MSTYADEGTAAHTLAERCLKDGSDACDHVGESITIQHYKHSRLGASQAHRWLVCTASVVASGEDDTVPGPGTTWEVTDEMAEAVQVYLDEVRKTLKDLPGSQLFIEQAFDLSDLYPGMAGSCDAVIIQPLGKVRVLDYKHGAGKPVEAKDNAQMKFYGIGALRNAWDVDELELTIVQPRAFHRSGPVRNWSVAPADVVTWGQTHLKAKAEEAFSNKAKFVAGDHCKYCKYSPNCEKIRQTTTETAMTMFSPINEESRSPALIVAAKLTDEQIGRTLDFAGMVGDWIKSVEAEAYARAMRGQFPLGYKIVQGKGGNRKWISDEAVAAAIPDKTIRCVEEIRSPAALEKELKRLKIKLDIAPLVTQSPGKPSLVPITDPRPAISATPFTPIASSDASFLE